MDELWTRARTSIPAFIVVLLLAWPILRDAALASGGVRVSYATAIGVGFLRWLCAAWVTRRGDALSHSARYRIMLGTALANGLALCGLNVLLYPRLGPLELGLWVMFLGGISSGATISLGARPEVFLAFSVPQVTAFIVAPFFFVRPGMLIVALVALIWSAYSLAQVIQYRRSRRDFLKLNLDLRKNNAELARKNLELIEMGRRADRIFAALGEALPGTVLAGKYKLESRIGVGGFAIVFRGTHLQLDRPVAVKVFRPQAGNDSNLSLERFREEAIVNSKVRHPNIVEVIDAGVGDDGIPYIAMDLLDGRTLEEELRDVGQLAPARATTIMRQVCEGLAAAHASGVVHRDVKPDNIFLHREGGEEVVKLLDFGIAKLADAARLGRTQLTSTGDFVGTPHYMPPERFLAGESGAGADVYAVGVVLFRTLVGRMPFEGTVAEIITQKVSGRRPDTRSLPEDVASAIEAALADDPATRPSATELAHMLDRASATTAKL